MRVVRLLTLFTKPSCTLCHELKYVVDDVAEKLATTIDVRLEEVNIDEPQHARWRREYFYDIPVLHLDGQPLLRHRCTAAQLEQALLSAPGTASSTK